MTERTEALDAARRIVARADGGWPSSAVLVAVALLDGEAERDALREALGHARAFIVANYAGNPKAVAIGLEIRAALSNGE